MSETLSNRLNAILADLRAFSKGARVAGDAVTPFFVLQEQNKELAGSPDIRTLDVSIYNS